MYVLTPQMYIDVKPYHYNVPFIHINVQILTPVCLDLYACVCVCVYTCAKMYIYMYICIYACMYICIYVYMYIYAYICIYIYMYICIYVYKHIVNTHICVCILFFKHGKMKCIPLRTTRPFLF